MKLRTSVFLFACLLFVGRAAHATDTIEFLSGAKATGTIVSQDDTTIVMKVKIGNSVFTRKYPTDRIHALTVDGKRAILNAKSTTSSTKPKGSANSPRSSSTSSTSANTGNENERAETEVRKLIDDVGRTPPDWYDDTPLNYPKTLDLSFPQPPPAGWNNQKNVGQYIWDVINPNPSKWREGVKLMHHLLLANQNNRNTQIRIMNALGRMYHNLHEDHARAAFWWQQAGADKNTSDFPGVSLDLAECYWQLGNREMAFDLIKRTPTQFATIKLLGDMGETDAALKIADDNANGSAAEIALLNGGDACRVAGRIQDALQYYQRVLKVPATGNRAKKIEKYHSRAQASIAAIRLFDTLEIARVPDGKYAAESIGYEAPVRIEVSVRGGKIQDVRVTQHREKQFYSSIADTPRKIIAKQHVKGVDATSGATITSEAIINATAKALSAAMK